MTLKVELRLQGFLTLIGTVIAAVIGHEKTDSVHRNQKTSQPAATTVATTAAASTATATTTTREAPT